MKKKISEKELEEVREYIRKDLEEHREENIAMLKQDSISLECVIEEDEKFEKRFWEWINSSDDEV